MSLLLNMPFVQMLTEGVRTPHPEDFIFAPDGVQQSLAVLDALEQAAEPDNISIKWDGSPAIIFGRRSSDGRFTMNYKEYIASPGGQVTSPEELVDWFAKNGKNMVVAQKLANMFNAVATIVPDNFQGFVQGDVMWDTVLEPHGGKFIFRANPHGVTYKVDAGSPVGKEIAGRPVGIAVHTYGSDVEKSKNDSSLLNKTPLKGLGGLSGTNKYVTVLTSNMNIHFQVAKPTAMINRARRVIKQYGPVVQEFLSSVTQSTRNVLQTYYNRKITNQPVSTEWLASKLSSSQFQIVQDNIEAIKGIDAIWSAIYAVKMHLVQQLDPQVKGIEQYVGHDPNNLQPSGEGFAINTPVGLVKLVNRGVFSAANFAGRA